MSSATAWRAPTRAAQSEGKEYAIAASAVVACFGIAQVVHILRQFNSPSASEARAALAGMRTLDGYGWSDGYLRSLPGSLIWPVLSGGAFDLWGTAGPRIVALLLVVGGFLALLSATRSLFGERAAFFTAVTLAISAPFWILGHIGSMEALALAGGCLAIWAIARLAASDHRGWLLLATAMLVLAMLAQYRAVLLLIPASMLLAALRQRRAAIDIGLMWLLCALALVIYFDVFATQIAGELSPRDLFGPAKVVGSFDATGGSRAVVALWGGAPLVAGLLAWARNRALRPVIAAFIAGPAIWIGLWLLGDWASTASIQLDLALGTVLLYPVLGLWLAEMTDERARLLTLVIVALALALLSLNQTRAFDQGWPDSSEPVAMLIESLQPGDRVLVNERWPYALALYDADRIEEPGDVLDEPLLFQRDTFLDFCSFSWFVDSAPPEGWSPLVQTAIGSCGTFEPVLTSSSEVARVASSLRSSEQTVQTVVQRNSRPFQGEL